MRAYLILAAFTAVTGHTSCPKVVEIKACFTPYQDCASILVQKIKEAKSSIYVQAYSFTNNTLATALISAKRRGIEVHVYIDKGRILEPFSKAYTMLEEGIPVAVQTSSGLAHNKIMIIDQELVITGSFNFTNNALKNEENINFIKSKELAALYFDNWNKILKKGE